MDEVKKSSESEPTDEESDSIEITFFKSDTCAFCPRAEEIIRSTIEGFETDLFKLIIINVSEDPTAAEEYGIFALPTTMIGGMSITGIPEPEMLMKMILGSRISKKKGEKDE